MIWFVYVIDEQWFNAFFFVLFIFLIFVLIDCNFDTDRSITARNDAIQ